MHESASIYANNVGARLEPKVTLPALIEEQHNNRNSAEQIRDRIIRLANAMAGQEPATPKADQKEAEPFSVIDEHMRVAVRTRNIQEQTQYYLDRLEDAILPNHGNPVAKSAY